MILDTRKKTQRALTSVFSSAKEIIVSENFKRKQVTICIALPWWKWLGCGLTHWFYRRKAEALLFAQGVAGVVYIVKII